MKLLKSKRFKNNKKQSKVELFRDGDFYIVKVDGDTYTNKANILFAMQIFNAI